MSFEMNNLAAANSTGLSDSAVRQGNRKININNSTRQKSMNMEDISKETAENIQQNRKMAMMFLLFEEKGEMPSDEVISEKLKAKGYDAKFEWKANDKSFRIFYLPKYTIDFTDAKNVPYQISMFDFSENEKGHGNALARTQFWATPNGVELLDTCRWQVMIVDEEHNPRWKCRYEMSMIEPTREVLDVNTGDYAAGNRNQNV